MTQEELAEKLNISRQAVTKWESGKTLPSISNLKEIAIIFNIKIDELVQKKIIKKEVYNVNVNSIYDE